VDVQLDTYAAPECGSVWRPWMVLERAAPQRLLEQSRLAQLRWVCKWSLQSQPRTVLLI
jgi:hypothetical protein